MESFHISSELIEDSSLSKFGNMKVFNKGWYVFNTKGLGIYFTLFLLFGSYGVAVFLMFKILSQTSAWISFIILTISTFVSFIMTLVVSFSNPGYIKPESRDLEKDANISSLIVTVGEQNYFLKYCKTCKIVRDLRVFHCKSCGLCVTRHDHHCPWLSVCIGLQNHKKFLLLVLISLFHCFLLITILTLIISNFSEDNEANFYANLTNFYYSFTILLFSVVVVFTFLLILLIFFQIKFISNNETTSENIRRPNNITNPFDKGCKKNIKDFLEDMNSFKNQITYTPNSKGYLMGVQLITDFLAIVSRRSSKNSEISREKKDDLNISTSSFKTSDKIVEE